MMHAVVRSPPDYGPKWAEVIPSKVIKLTGAQVPNERAHAALHVIVENQLDERIPLVRKTLDRLMAEGLSRHDAVHAISSVQIVHLQDLLRENAKTPDSPEPYFQALEALTAAGWHEEFGTPQSCIPVAMTIRERDLIRETIGCDSDFWKSAIVEGAEITVELSLDGIEEIQGCVAAEANHTTHAKRRKELACLVDSLPLPLPLLPAPRVFSARSQISDLDPGNTGKMFAIIRQDLCEPAILHVTRVIGIDKIDVGMDVEVESQEEQRGVGTFQIWSI